MGQSSSFAPAFFLLPARRREALFALHLFCRAADDAVDQAGPPRLPEMQREIDALFGQGSPRLPETARLLPFVREFDLRRAHFDLLLAALARDARGEAIADEADLVRYSEGVASAPGNLALAIFGASSAEAYARSLGIALQCTNILRDVREDWAVGRLYLPATDLAQLGISAHQLFSIGRGETAPGPAVQQLLDRHRARVTRWFDAAFGAFRDLPAATRGRLASARAMERIYRTLASQLEQRDPVHWRAHVGPSAVLAALCISWWEAHRNIVFAHR